MSVETRQDRQASLRERGDLSDLFATALVLIRGNKRSELQRQNLRMALQLFQENRLATVIAGSTDALPKDILTLLSQPVERALPRNAVNALQGWGAQYIGEILRLPRDAWRNKAHTQYGQAIRTLLVEWGIPFDLDLNAVGWVPPYAEDPAVVAVWNMRKHDLVPLRPCNETEGCESVGEFIRSMASRNPRAFNHPSYRPYVEQLWERGLRLTMWVPGSWSPPARDICACARHATVEWEGEHIRLSLKEALERQGLTTLESLTTFSKWELLRKFGGPEDPHARSLMNIVQKRGLQLRDHSPGDHRDQSLDEFEFSVRTANCLRNEGIYFVGQLIEKTELDLLRTPNFGRRSLNEVKEALARLGLNLKPSPAGAHV